ncbi:MAG: PEP-CTERM sorting domain-containing protein [Verrucomicrobiota bacterium]|nr:PEP-CTERM sorting domain-containing protein [Verrucomicrobiota bacterium]
MITLKMGAGLNSIGTAVIFATNNLSSPMSIATKPAPEPSTCALLAVGIAAVAALRRKRALS